MSHDEQPDGDPHGECRLEIDRLLACLQEGNELRGLWARVYAATVQGLTASSGFTMATGVSLEMVTAWQERINEVAEVVANEAVMRAAVRWSGASPEDIENFNDATRSEAVR